MFSGHGVALFIESVYEVPRDTAGHGGLVSAMCTSNKEKWYETVSRLKERKRAWSSSACVFVTYKAYTDKRCTIFSATLNSEASEA